MIYNYRKHYILLYSSASVRQRKTFFPRHNAVLFSFSLSNNILHLSHLVLSFIIDGPSEAHSVSDNVTLYCETKNFIEMIEISLIWIDVNDLKTNSSDNFIISELSTNNMVLSELQIRGIPLVQAGIYTCEATVTFNEISQKISRTHPVEVQGK